MQQTCANLFPPSDGKPSLATNEPYRTVFIDGPNIDGVLGWSVLERRPCPEDRPRWERVLRFLRREGLLAPASKPCFVVNRDRFCRSSQLAFGRVLQDFGYEVCAAHSSDGVESDPVDGFILQQLERQFAASCSGLNDPIVLFSHDHGFADVLARIRATGRRVAIFGFTEWFAQPLYDLQEIGCEIFDLEFDVPAFDIRLPRTFAPQPMTVQ